MLAPEACDSFGVLRTNMSSKSGEGTPAVGSLSRSLALFLRAGGLSGAV